MRSVTRYTFSILYVWSLWWAETFITDLIILESFRTCYTLICLRIPEERCITSYTLLTIEMRMMIWTITKLVFYIPNLISWTSQTFIFFGIPMLILFITRSTYSILYIRIITRTYTFTRNLVI